MSETTVTEPWHQSLTPTQWKTLLAANLGWLFDGFETNALILTAGPAMRSLLDPSQYAQIPAYVSGRTWSDTQARFVDALGCNPHATQ